MDAHGGRHSAVKRPPRGLYFLQLFECQGQGESVDSEAKEGGGVGRSQNVVYVMPEDWASIAHFLSPLIDRLDSAVASLQLLVVTPDAESAAAVGAAGIRLAGDRPIRIIAATAVARATRLMKGGPPHIVAGDPATILALIRETTLKLDQLRAIAIAWADSLLASNQSSDLEALFADLPKEAAHVIVAGQLSPDVETFIERYARRARRVVAAPGDAAHAVSIEYVTTTDHGRLAALRRILDEVDPATAVIHVRTDDANREANEALRALGYADAHASIRVSHGGGGAELVVLYELPASREELREAVGPDAKRVIATIQPRQLPSLRTLAGGGTVKPLSLPDAGSRARAQNDAMLTELRRTLESRQFGRQLLAIEPLLDAYDGIEIAAAALQLLETERAAAAARPSPRAAPAEMARVFLTIGARDNVRPGDLVGAITGEAGISSVEMGRVDIRESHTIVEVAANVAPTVIAKMDGASIRGRKIAARADLGPGERPSAERRPRDDRPRDRGTRPASSGPRGGPRGGPPRGAPRAAGGGGGRFGGGSRPDRPPPGRGSSDRPARPGGGPRSGRPARSRDRE
jgi:ATP-dependent RNA helicase DeaD